MMIGFVLTVAIFIGIRLNLQSANSRIFLLGDSGIGNYRIQPGQRLEDDLERLNPGVEVVNWAEPGASPMDYYLQFTRGALLAGQPQIAVIGLSPDKFLGECAKHRFTGDGVNLRWLPWTSSGWRLFKSLTPHEKNVAILQQASLPFFALADLTTSLWDRFVKWPSQRNAMLAATRERRRIAERKSFQHAKDEEGLVIGDDRGFSELPMAKDTEFLLNALHESGVETRVMVLPMGDPGLILASCSPRVLAKHDSIVVRMRNWLNARQEVYLDFNTPEELAHFPDSVWDDWNHLKSPVAFAYISEKVKKTLPSIPSRSSQQSVTMLESGNGDVAHRREN